MTRLGLLFILIAVLAMFPDRSASADEDSTTRPNRRPSKGASAGDARSSSVFRTQESENEDGEFQESADKPNVPDEHDRRLDAAAAMTERIIQKMRLAGKRIAVRETGGETQKAQKEVVNDLQLLIEAAEKMQSARSSRQQSQQSRPPDDSSEQEFSQKESDAGAGAATRKSDDSGINSTEATGETNAREAELARRRSLIGEVWGHLPESLRQRLRNDLGEKTLPGYDDLIRKYFEALAEEGKPGSKSSEKRIK